MEGRVEVLDTTGDEELRVVVEVLELTTVVEELRTEDDEVD
jgi:hypothetical protein